MLTDKRLLPQSTMRLQALSVLQRKTNNENPVILALATDLSNVGYFQQTALREFIELFSKTVASKTAEGARQSVSEKGAVFHAYHLAGDDQLVGSSFSLIVLNSSNQADCLV